VRGNKMLTKLRKKARLSQGDVAKMLGVTNSFVSQWENNRRHPPAKKIKELAKILKCEVDFLSKVILTNKIKKLRDKK